MKITRTSPLTGQPTTLDLDVTDDQLSELASPSRRHIQNIFPTLSASDREFLLTGYTQADWDKMFPPEEEHVPGRAGSQGGSQ